jgi:hypothetical protein
VERRKQNGIGPTMSGGAKPIKRQLNRTGYPE